MATSESVIKSIAQERFKGFSYVFDDWTTADARLEKLDYPAILCILPVSGTTEIRNGRVFDTENIALAFLDIAPRDADGEENEEVYTRMKVAGARFIHELMKSRQFEGLEGRQQYQTIIERLSSIVSGVMYSLTLTQAIGGCADG